MFPNKLLTIIAAPAISAGVLNYSNRGSSCVLRYFKYEGQAPHLIFLLHMLKRFYYLAHTV